MKTLMILLLNEQSDLGLHCLPRPICPKTLDHFGIFIILVSINAMKTDTTISYEKNIDLHILNTNIHI